MRVHGCGFQIEAKLRLTKGDSTQKNNRVRDKEQKNAKGF